jgi:hypothetical protein
VLPVQERLTLLEDVMSAEAEYVVPPCPVAAYATPPSKQDFEPYLRKLRQVSLLCTVREQCGWGWAAGRVVPCLPPHPSRGRGCVNLFDGCLGGHEQGSAGEVGGWLWHAPPPFQAPGSTVRLVLAFCCTLHCTTGSCVYVCVGGCHVQANASTGGVGARLPSTTLDVSMGRREVEVVTGAPAKPPARTVVPALFFRDDFDLRDPATFHESLCATTSLILQQKVCVIVADHPPHTRTRRALSTPPPVPRASFADAAAVTRQGRASPSHTPPPTPLPLPATR